PRGGPKWAGPRSALSPFSTCSVNFFRSALPLAYSDNASVRATSRPVFESGSSELRVPIGCLGPQDGDLASKMFSTGLREHGEDIGRTASQIARQTRDLSEGN